MSTQSLEGAKKRNLGFDLMRIFAVFMIFMGGNTPIIYQLLETAGKANLVIAPNGFVEIFYMSLWQHLTHGPIPYLVMMSGFFYFSKQYSRNEWINAKSTFVKYFLFFVKWILVALVAYLILGSGMGAYGYLGSTPWKELSIPFKIEIVLQNILCGFSSFTGFVSSSGTLWTVVSLAWLTLVGCVLKPYFQKAEIKHVRQFVLIVFLIINVSTGIRDIGTYFLNLHPDSVICTFFANFAFWDGLCVDFSGATILSMYLIGGLLAVDKELQQKLTNMSWKSTVIVCVISMFVFLFVCHYFGDYTEGVGSGMALNRYESFLWILYAGVMLILAFKLGQILKSERGIGKFVSRYAMDFVGGVITVHVFGYNLLTPGGVFHWVFVWMAETFTNPFLLNLAYVAFNIAYFSIVMVIVHWLRKVPVVKGLFWWDKVTVFDKERLPEEKTAV